LCFDPILFCSKVKVFLEKLFFCIVRIKNADWQILQGYLRFETFFLKIRPKNLKFLHLYIGRVKSFVIRRSTIDILNLFSNIFKRQNGAIGLFSYFFPFSSSIRIGMVKLLEVPRMFYGKAAIRICIDMDLMEW
jgi:hypothetical protein